MRIMHVMRRLKKNKGERDMEPKEEACEWVKEADHNDRIDGGA